MLARLTVTRGVVTAGGGDHVSLDEVMLTRLVAVDAFRSRSYESVLSWDGAFMIVLYSIWEISVRL